MIATNAIVQTPTATYCGDDEFNDEGYPDVDPTWLINWRNRTEYLLDATPAQQVFLQEYLCGLLNDEGEASE